MVGSNILHSSPRHNRFHDEFHSIFPMGDISALIPDDEADVCVLEEPEHLNWWVRVDFLHFARI